MRVLGIDPGTLTSGYGIVSEEDQKLFHVVSGGISERDFSGPYVPCAEVEAAWAVVYKDTERHWDLYELAEKLVDLEDRFQVWRYAHLRTVERIIGHKPGTGGTPGVPYLAKVLEQKFFPELFSVRTVL